MARTSDPKADGIIEAIESSSSVGVGIGSSGNNTVTTAGTRVQLSVSSVPCKRVWIQAYESNGALDPTSAVVVCVGGSNVVAAEATRNGHALYPASGDWFPASNLNQLWLDATFNGAKVSYHYEI